MKVSKKGIMWNMAGLFPFLFIVALLLLYLALPNRTFSIEERRYLAQWPVFRIEDVLDGSYGIKVETYFLDQFPWRDFWVDVQEGLNQVLIGK